jgi:SAM-dependent methyltransferase
MSNFYNLNAKRLFNKYQSVDSSQIHSSWLVHLPPNPGLALDVGSGSGRDAAWLAQKGWQVTAVEPAAALFELGRKATEIYSVIWINDYLPALSRLQGYRRKFSLILVSGVLMHLPYQQRVESLETLAGLMAENSVLVVTLRNGPDPEGREFYQVPADEIVQFAENNSMQVEVSDFFADELKRKDITWQTVIVKCGGDD